MASSGLESIPLQRLLLLSLLALKLNVNPTLNVAWRDPIVESLIEEWAKPFSR